MVHHSKYLRSVLFFAVLVGLVGACKPRVPSQLDDINVESGRIIGVGEQASLTLPLTDIGLEFEWKASRGTLSNSKKSWVVYTAPASPGLDIVTVTVTGRGDDKVIQKITFQVVEPAPSPMPTSATADHAPLGSTAFLSDLPQAGKIEVDFGTEILVGEQVNLVTENLNTDFDFEWTVLRGSLSSFEKPSVIYTAPISPGFDTVSVTITGKDDESKILQAFFRVLEPTPVPTIAPTWTAVPAAADIVFPGEPPQISEISVDFEAVMVAGEQANFIIHASGINLGFRWTAARGTFSNDRSPWAIYTAPMSPGPDTVMVKVTSEGGGSTIQSLTFPVVAPTPTLTPTPWLCASPQGEGMIVPAITISSITFNVNGNIYVVDQFTPLKASAGDAVRVDSIQVCVEPFEGERGEVYVEFDPVDQEGEVIPSEVKGTAAVEVKPGYFDIPGVERSGEDLWLTLGDWRHISVVTVHYPGLLTRDLSCENAHCEIDDRMLVLME
ncbi:MAG: hypothetical protein JXR84_02910 [Anaerolineae bacterium]|nr:hypothetical protein [Anaerolineae bacterium]